MELIDAAPIPRSREAVWKTLNDPDMLRRVVPGCEAPEVIADGRMRAQVTLKVGPVKARFIGEITFSDVVPPVSYVLTGEGKGGIAGCAKATATVNLEEVGSDQALLHYQARADVGGKLAQLGARLLDSTAQKLARQFLNDFCKLITQDSAATHAGHIPSPILDSALRWPGRALRPTNGGASPSGVPPWTGRGQSDPRLFSTNGKQDADSGGKRTFRRSKRIRTLGRTSTTPLADHHLSNEANSAARLLICLNRPIVSSMKLPRQQKRREEYGQDASPYRVVAYGSRRRIFGNRRKEYGQ